MLPRACFVPSNGHVVCCECESIVRHRWAEPCLSCRAFVCVDCAVRAATTRPVVHTDRDTDFPHVQRIHACSVCFPCIPTLSEPRRRPVTGGAADTVSSAVLESIEILDDALKPYTSRWSTNPTRSRKRARAERGSAGGQPLAAPVAADVPEYAPTPPPLSSVPPARTMFTAGGERPKFVLDLTDDDRIPPNQAAAVSPVLVPSARKPVSIVQIPASPPPAEHDPPQASLSPSEIPSEWLDGAPRDQSILDTLRAKVFAMKGHEPIPPLELSTLNGTAAN